MDKKINVIEFIELIKRYTACFQHSCGDCPYEEECNDESANEGKAPGQKLADTLEFFLPELEKYQEISSKEFVDLITGGD